MYNWSVLIVSLALLMSAPCETRSLTTTRFPSSTACTTTENRIEVCHFNCTVFQVYNVGIGVSEMGRTRERSMQDVTVERSQVIFTAIVIARKIVQCYCEHRV